jgi:hypothetical protein
MTIRYRSPVRALVFVLLTVAFAFGSTFTLAQTKGKPVHPRPKKPKTDAAASTDVDASIEPMAGRPESAPPVRDAGGRSASSSSQRENSDVVEAKTLDGGAKVFRFGEVEIEGRLRSPQLVYFLRRVRAEFSAGDLGHRTFMRELSDTRSDPSF